MFVRNLFTALLVLAVQQCAYGGLMVGESVIEQQISVQAVGELMNAGEGETPVVSERTESEDDLNVIDLSATSSPPSVAACCMAVISIRLQGCERLLYLNLFPPPNPDLDGLLKPPQVSNNYVFS